jgi:phosphotransferase system  glucose/maltose/N-acetylglucosamine-specific IIC component
MAGTSEPAPPPLPWLFFVVAIVMAIAAGAILAYLGLTGHLGGGIPGSSSPGNGLGSLPVVGIIVSFRYQISGGVRW